MYRPAIIIHLSAVAALLLIVGCATLPKDFDRPESYALTDTENTALSKARGKERAAHPGKSGFHLLYNGVDAFRCKQVLKDVGLTFSRPRAHCESFGKCLWCKNAACHGNRMREKYTRAPEAAGFQRILLLSSPLWPAGRHCRY